LLRRKGLLALVQDAPRHTLPRRFQIAGTEEMGGIDGGWPGMLGEAAVPLRSFVERRTPLVQGKSHAHPRRNATRRRRLLPIPGCIQRSALPRRREERSHIRELDLVRQWRA